MNGWGRWEVIFLIDGLDGALKAEEERFCAGEDGKKVHCAGELVDYSFGNVSKA